MNMEIIGLPKDRTQDTLQFKQDELLPIEGVEMDPKEDSFTVELKPNQPFTVRYSSGREFTFELRSGVKSMPLEFLSNYQNIGKAMQMFKAALDHYKEGTLTRDMKENLKENALNMYASPELVELGRGSTIYITLNYNDKEVILDSDPVPGVNLNTSIARTEAVRVDENGIITSVVIRCTKDFNVSMKHDPSLIGTTPELTAAAS
ncbi:MAG: hypothetical protein ACMG57_00960 [Candidatus Dojkabacteria bacterium]